LNVAASRLTTGNHALYGRLEERLAAFFGAGDAVIVANGYLTNLIAAQVLAGEFSHALVDEKAHPSLCDAAEFLNCPVMRFKSRDAADLARAVERCGPGAKIVLLTDGMFASDGGAAPLKKYKEALPKDALMLVDDAHAAGVLGATGRGTLEYDRVARRGIVQTATLSKAFGVYGGVILCSKQFRRRILNHSRMFIGGTPLPLPLANAALIAIGILEKEGSVLRKRLNENVAFVRNGLRAAGQPLNEAPGPIVALAPQSARGNAAFKRALLAAGIYPPFVRYPGGPAQGYFRFVISSEHSRAQLDQLLGVLAR